MPTIRAFFDSIIDVILPPKARTARAKRLSVSQVPLSPTAHSILGVSISTLTDYRRQEVQDLIQSLKYDGNGHAAHICAAVLAEYLIEELASESLFSTKKILLVPVPLHTARRRERGFNQMEVVLRSLPKDFRDGTHARLAPEVLVRERATKQQTRLHRSERLSNVAGAFTVPDPSLVKGTHVFLIDDVVTTGATLANAATPLRRAGATVTLLALARA